MKKCLRVIAVVPLLAGVAAATDEVPTVGLKPFWAIPISGSTSSTKILELDSQSVASTCTAVAASSFTTSTSGLEP